MVKTLKITTILIALAALGLVIFIAAKGIASDKDIEKFLAAPGIVEQLQTGSTGKKAADTEQDTPLIRQARDFALRINPPPPPMLVDMPAPDEALRPKVTVTAKFTLVGTSYHTGDEENSWALINEVGKGWHWVKQGEKAGHLMIEKIGDGVVLIRDGDTTYELATEKQQKPDYVISFTGTVAPGKAPLSWQGTENTVTEAVSQEQSPVSSTENAQTALAASPGVAKEVTKEEIQGNIAWVKQLQENPKSLGMTAEEAKELEGLGELLRSLETELKNVEPNTAGEVNSVETKDANGTKISPETVKQQQSEPNSAAPMPSRIRRRR